MISKKWLLALGVSGLLAFGVAACGDDDDDDSGGSDGEAVSGTIAIDGSSTVAPFAEAAAELFNEENPDVDISVGASGTGGGFEKFCVGETDISDASRPIDEKEEVPVCEKEGIEYTEVQVANDGVAIVTNPGRGDLVPHDRPARAALVRRHRSRTTATWVRTPTPASRSPTSTSASTGPAPTPGRSSTSPRRSTVRKARAAPTTSRRRTTTSSSPGLPATRAASRTSDSPTTSRTPTSSTWFRSTRATGA